MRHLFLAAMCLVLIGCGGGGELVDIDYSPEAPSGLVRNGDTISWTDNADDELYFGVAIDGYTVWSSWNPGTGAVEYPLPFDGYSVEVWAENESGVSDVTGVYQ
ncbi:MAG: hypothetical protein GY847_14265 [Proteobacteria bacterium]|nr:hypothetical protein [Pseudomonadota bacterium]